MNKPTTNSLNLIADSAASPAKKWLWRGVVLAVVVGAAAWWWLAPTNAPQTHYVSEEATQAKLVVTVSATGNLQPINQVDVGSELSGTIEKVLVEENDHIKRGQVLAQLDLSKLNDQVTKSRAAVAAAQANVVQMKATVAESKANLERLKRVAELSGGKVPSKTEMEAAEAAYQRAEANALSAEASVKQAQATLKSDETNIVKATIHAPTDGVVLTRKVEPGQTVAASLQAPVLFTIAEDLAQMQLQVNVDEADVSQVKEGQSAFFTVDSWPGRKFPATISRVGYGSQTVDGVVSYKTILKVKNDDLSLRPGMTATAEITTAVHENALLVPNAALRFSPPQNAGAKKNVSLVASLLPRPPRDEQKKAVKDLSGGPRVWVLQDGKPVPIKVKTGLSNGRYTEVLEGDLKPGMRVITETEKPQK